jgi:hypothetical protein
MLIDAVCFDVAKTRVAMDRKYLPEGTGGGPPMA